MCLGSPRPSEKVKPRRVLPGYPPDAVTDNRLPPVQFGQKRATIVEYVLQGCSFAHGLSPSKVASLTLPRFIRAIAPRGKKPIAGTAQIAAEISFKEFEGSGEGAKGGISDPFGACGGRGALRKC